MFVLLAGIELTTEYGIALHFKSSIKKRGTEKMRIFAGVVVLYITDCIRIKSKRNGRSYKLLGFIV